MNKYVVFFVCIVQCTGCVSSAKRDKGSIIYKEIYDGVVEAGLPYHGSVVKAPMQSDKWYYYTSRWWFERINGTGQGSPYGLWVSENNGTDWSRLSLIPDFVQVMVHPRSALLFAIISDDYYRKGASGVLDVGVGYKIVVSNDGYDWTDITPSGEYLFHDAEPIFPDPDSENGVCVYQQTDGVMWQTSGEKPMKWRKYSIEEWVQEHPDWTNDDMIPDGVRVESSGLMRGEKISDEKDE